MWSCIGGEEQFAAMLAFPQLGSPTVTNDPGPVFGQLFKCRGRFFGARTSALAGARHPHAADTWDD
jgi:hypothetical protein